jgi:glucoamylase
VTHSRRRTVTTQGTLVPGISRHYIRINPADTSHCADEDPNCGTLILANQPPGDRVQFPAKEIVDAGFLELVRYGIRSADDAVIKDSLRVVDAVLKVDTPVGPCWRRYNHDGYGQREDGGSYKYWGTGRAWPLLTGERGHYELARGRDAGPYLRALEKFSQGIGLIPWTARRVCPRSARPAFPVSARHRHTPSDQVPTDLVYAGRVEFLVRVGIHHWGAERKPAPINHTSGFRQ